jgi:uncharacterized membrane protein
MKTAKTYLWLWFLIAIFGIFAVLKATPFSGSIQGFIPAISILVPTLFAAVHGLHRLGGRTMLVFFSITFVVSWCYESLSIATGFPFGHYHYTNNLGPKLGTVPLLIMPAYFAMCYVSWTLAHVLLDKWNQKSDQMLKFAIPLIASFIMVMWDMCMDPARATVKQAWIWHDGGGYFGVPFSNFLGWFLCVYTIFQLLAIYLIRGASAGKVVQDQANAMYAATSLEFVTLGFFPPTGTVTDAVQQVWQLSALYETLGLVALFTMVFVSVLAFLKVQTNRELT